jgi:DNA-binding NtrC family response regulator
VRELASVIDRAVILGNGERLDVATALGAVPSAARAPARELGATAAREPAAAAAGGAAASAGSIGPSAAAPDAPFPTLDEATARHIEAALARTRGRIEGPRGAAALLGVNPHTLRARMRRLRVDWRRFRAPARRRGA